ncbi:MAG: DnaJ domain-containing protein [Verrucomicrobiota bacterium]
MSSKQIQDWLRIRRRNALAVSWLYSVFALVGGMVASLPFLLVFYLFIKIMVLYLAPTTLHADLWSGGIALLGIGLICADCIYSERDDLSFIPRWLLREFLHAGPRLSLDGYRHAVRGTCLFRMDYVSRADVLSYLLNKSSSVSKEELLKAFPDLNWSRLINELRQIEGILFLRDSSRLSLTSVLRSELSQLMAQTAQSRIVEDAPQPNPVDDVQSYSPYEILGLAPDASIAEIKSAYRRRIKGCHPDRFAGMDERSRQLAEEWTKALNAAYETMVARSSCRA